MTGIEPVLYHYNRILSPARLPVPPHGLIEWAEVDSNHRSNLQQIYSLSPLATRESAHVPIEQNHCSIAIAIVQARLAVFMPDTGSCLLTKR